MACLRGFEPPTFGSGVQRSICPTKYHAHESSLSAQHEPRGDDGSGMEAGVLLRCDCAQIVLSSGLKRCKVV
jgi:hypothetical protein